MAIKRSPGRIPAALAGDGVDCDVQAAPEVLIHGTTRSTVEVSAAVPTPKKIVKIKRYPRRKCRNEPAPRTIRRFGADAL
jgi:hypothetical protein